MGAFFPGLTGGAVGFRNSTESMWNPFAVAAHTNVTYLPPSSLVPQGLLSFSALAMSLESCSRQEIPCRGAPFERNLRWCSPSVFYGLRCMEHRGCRVVLLCMVWS